MTYVPLTGVAGISFVQLVTMGVSRRKSSIRALWWKWVREDSPSIGRQKDVANAEAYGRVFT